MGIERTYRKVEQASIVLWVIDLTAPVEKSIELASSIVHKLTGKEVILLFNKSDLVSEATLQAASQALLQSIEAFLPEIALNHLFISAKKCLGTEQLQDLLVQAAAIPSIGDEEVIVTNLRHSRVAHQGTRWHPPRERGVGERHQPRPAHARYSRMHVLPGRDHRPDHHRRTVGSYLQQVLYREVTGNYNKLQK